MIVVNKRKNNNLLQTNRIIILSHSSISCIFILCSSAEMSVLLATLKKNLTLARNMREQKRLESGTAKSRKVPGNIAVHEQPLYNVSIFSFFVFPVR